MEIEIAQRITQNKCHCPINRNWCSQCFKHTNKKSNCSLERTMSERQAGRPGLSALVVDEDKHHTNYLKYMLPRFNIQVTVYTSPIKALNFVKDYAQDVHFLLVAVNMKEMSGFQFLDIARNMHQNIQVIMMSTTTTMDIMKRCVELGARFLVKKPLDAPTIRNLWQHLDLRALRMKKMSNLLQALTGEHSATKSAATYPSDDQSASEAESTNKGSSDVQASTGSNIVACSPLNYTDSKDSETVENDCEGDKDSEADTSASN
ncbi:hypothetical protein ACP70R_042660 [Stipagrostis hirtigluma subsp. patula]